jgi:hypothetical protein
VFGSYEGLREDSRKKDTPLLLEEEEEEDDKFILLKCSERKSGQRNM